MKRLLLIFLHNYKIIFLKEIIRAQGESDKIYNFNTIHLSGIEQYYLCNNVRSFNTIR